MDQYKEEITLKDHRLVKEHFDHHSVEKQKDGLKAELHSVKRQMQSSKQVCMWISSLPSPPPDLPTIPRVRLLPPFVVHGPLEWVFCC